ncbi:Uncharacterised protein r2_g1857 [Pycnogonum litorale]
MLRDRLITGLCVGNDYLRIQERLLQEKDDSTFHNVHEIAIAMENAMRDSKTLKEQKLTGAVNKASAFIRGKRHKPKQGASRYASQQTPVKKTICYRCGSRDHASNRCKHIDTTCDFCHKNGHLKHVCRSNPHSILKNNSAHSETKTIQVKEEDASFGNIWKLSTSANINTYATVLNVNSKPVHFEIDTGSAVTLMNLKEFRNIFGEHPTIYNSTLELKSFTGQNLSVVGQTKVTVKYNKKSKYLPLIVVDNEGPALLGRNWLEFDILKQRVSKICSQNKMDELIQEFPGLFTDKLGCLRNVHVKFELQEEAEPRFLKARPLPFAMRQ